MDLRFFDQVASFYCNERIAISFLVELAHLNAKSGENKPISVLISNPKQRLTVSGTLTLPLRSVKFCVPCFGDAIHDEYAEHYLNEKKNEV